MQVLEKKQGKKEREPDIEEIATKRVEDPLFLEIPEPVEVKSCQREHEKKQYGQNVKPFIHAGLLAV